MRLNRLQLCNFRQHVDTCIDFDAGITGIIGPNGSGKTTLLEAIAWALYGMPAARGKRDSIRSYHAKGDRSTSVELDFELSGHRYVVVRTLNSAKLFLDGSSTPIATSISAVSDLLQRRLGMTKDEFFNTYFTGQKELGIMAAMGPTERAQFLSRVIGYERLKIAQELVRKRRSAIEAEVKGLRSAMPEPEVVKRALDESKQKLTESESRVASITARRENATKALEDATPHWERIQVERETFLAIASELRVVDGDRVARERDRDRITRELAEVSEARAALDKLMTEIAPLGALQIELRDLERAHSEEARRRTLTESLRVLGEELARSSQRQTEIESAPATEKAVAEQLIDARAELEKIQAAFETAHAEYIRDKQEATTKREELLKQLRDVQQQREHIVELGEDGICPFCSQKLESHFREVLDLLDTQIEEIKFNGKYFRSRMDQLAATPVAVTALDEQRKQLTEQVRALEQQRVKLQAEIKELTSLVRDLKGKEERRVSLSTELASLAVQYDASRHADVKREVDRLTPLAARATKLQAAVEREAALIPERDRVAAALSEIATHLAELTRRQSLLAFSEQTFTSIRETYGRAADTLRTVELAFVAAETEVAAAKNALASAEQARADLEKAEARLAELTRERRLHDELDRAFGDIRTDLNQELRPELSDRASRYIRELTDGRYGELELDEQYNVIVLEDAIPKPVISGGEEDLANLVLRLAISEMIAERAGQSFSLLILDEVFGSLDETRRHNVVDLLRRLQDRFEQVILITHIESVREGLDRVVTVRYDEESGTSSVETELAGGSVATSLAAGAAD